MDKDFMESVIWAFKELYNKGLIYKDYRVTPYCHRCETALSISETRESDSTRPKQDRWVIAKFKTDNYDTFHGSHTLGIMAGGYRDTMTVAKGTSSLSAKIETDYNPFYGAAYEADIAASCGDLNDMLIALGVEGVLDYAYKNQKPAVINLSLGSNVGAHDGTEIMSQYLNLAGEEAMFKLGINKSFLIFISNEFDIVLLLKLIPKSSTIFFLHLWHINLLFNNIK